MINSQHVEKTVELLVEFRISDCIPVSGYNVCCVQYNECCVQYNVCCVQYLFFVCLADQSSQKIGVLQE